MSAELQFKIVLLVELCHVEQTLCHQKWLNPSGKDRFSVTHLTVLPQTLPEATDALLFIFRELTHILAQRVFCAPPSIYCVFSVFQVDWLILVIEVAVVRRHPKRVVAKSFLVRLNLLNRCLQDTSERESR